MKKSENARISMSQLAGRTDHRVNTIGLTVKPLKVSQIHFEGHPDLLIRRLADAYHKAGVFVYE